MYQQKLVEQCQNSFTPYIYIYYKSEVIFMYEVNEVTVDL